MKRRMIRIMIRSRFITIRSVLMILLAVAVLLAVSGCTGIFFIPGASYGYYIWEEGDSIRLEWSVDKIDSKFVGAISTDGQIIDHRVDVWEENDIIIVTENSVNFESLLSSSDYSDAIILTFKDHTYIEFDLGINDGHDLSRIHIGGYLENPETDLFRIDKDYFDELKKKPWYKKHPYSEFFYKSYLNKDFTFIYLFILGTVLIGILRLTAFKDKKIYIFLPAAFAILAVIEIGIYYLLRFLV